MTNNNTLTTHRTPNTHLSTPRLRYGWTCEFLQDFEISGTQVFSTHPCLEWPKMCHKSSSMQFQPLWEHLTNLEKNWLFNHSRPVSFCKILRFLGPKFFQLIFAWSDPKCVIKVDCATPVSESHTNSDCEYLCAFICRNEPLMHEFHRITQWSPYHMEIIRMTMVQLQLKKSNTGSDVRNGKAYGYLGMEMKF